MTRANVKNYAAQGGDRWVVEGELQLAGKMTDADGNEIDPGGGGDIPDGSVTTAKLADKAVTAAKVADGAITKELLPNEMHSTTFKGPSNSSIVEVTDGNYRLALYTGGGARAADLGTESNHPLGFYTNGGRVWVELHPGEYVELKDTSTPPTGRGDGVQFFSEGGVLKYYGANGVVELTKPDLSGVEPIADPSAATVEDVSTAFNTLLNALKK